MSVQRTLVLVKPHAVESHLLDIIGRYHAAETWLNLVRSDLFTFTPEQVSEFYAEHRGKEFFHGLCEAMCEGPTYAMVFEGEDAVQVVRRLNGATDPKKAEPGTIRYDFADPQGGGPRNTVHGSDGVDAAAREIDIVFEWGCIQASRDGAMG